MLKELKQSFNDFVLERTADVCDNLIPTNEAYRAEGRKAEELFHRIKELLPEDQGHLMFRLEEVYTNQMEIQTNIVYEQALKDGMELRNLLKVVI